MKKLTSILAACSLLALLATHFSGNTVSAESQLDDPTDGFVLCLEQTYQFGVDAGTDCWGWQAPNGKEYAFMGIFNGIVCVNVTDHDIVDTIIGPQNGCSNIRWRDIKHYQHYLYAVSECTGTNQGLMIIDMNFLPDSLHFVRSFNTAADPTCHNLNIDTVKGFAYLCKANYDGFRVISLANPTNPVEFPFVNTGDIHDVFAYNDTVWVAEGNNSSFSVWNMANKNAAQFIARASFPDGGYVHNIWPSDDRHYVGTSQETAGRTVKVWDISNYANIQLVGNYLAPSGLVHNVHWQGDKFFTSHYESGVTAFSISDPENPVELARFDTYPDETPNFNGTWGVFPHTQSGRVYGSNLDGALYIFTTATVDVNADTLTGNQVFALPASRTSIAVSLDNGSSIDEVTIPIDYNGPLNLLFDSISVQGLRTNGWTKSKIVAGSPGTKRDVWKISGPSIAPGNGPIARFYFRIPGTAPLNDSSVIVFDNVLLTSPAEGVGGCYSFNMPTRPAVIKTTPSSACCVGLTGNVDGDLADNVDLIDLTVLVDHLFISFAELSCQSEANVDGSASLTADLLDLTVLVDHLFISFAPTANCQ